jgi:hypothetical protein
MESRRLFVLISPPNQLRHLRPTEVLNLRRAGVSCSAKWMISPFGDGSLGHLYGPSKRGGWDNTRIELGLVQ